MTRRNPSSNNRGCREDDVITGAVPDRVVEVTKTHPVVQRLLDVYEDPEQVIDDDRAYVGRAKRHDDAPNTLDIEDFDATVRVMGTGDVLVVTFEYSTEDSSWFTNIRCSYADPLPDTPDDVDELELNQARLQYGVQHAPLAGSGEMLNWTDGEVRYGTWIS